MKPFVGYIYKITIPTSEGLRYYWGRKIATSIKVNYFGSGVKLTKWIKAKTNGKVSAPYSMSVNVAKELGLTREIVAYAKTLDELYKLEKDIVAEHLGKEYCWNLIEGGLNSITYGNLGHHCSEETKEKIRKTKLGKKLSAEVRQHISEGHKGIPSPKGMLGKTLSKESKLKAKLTKIKNGTYRKKHSAETIFKIKASKRNISIETRKKMSEANHHKHIVHTEKYKKLLSERRKGKLNPAFGKKWWNNGKVCILSTTCPEGFIKGRLNKIKY